MGSSRTSSLVALCSLVILSLSIHAAAIRIEPSSLSTSETAHSSRQRGLDVVLSDLNTKPFPSVLGSLHKRELVYRPESSPLRRRLLQDDSSSDSDTLEVLASGYDDIQKAVLQANAQKTSVVVTLTSDVIITGPLPTIAFGTGLGIVGNCTTLDKRPRKCIIDGARRFTLFVGQFNCYISLYNLVIRNMRNGVHSGGCKFEARNVAFRHNVADIDGGAVLNTAGYDQINRSVWDDIFAFCDFFNNTVTNGRGGAIYSKGPNIKVTASRFLSNKASEAGGAIYSTGDVYIHSSLFSGNVAGEGGGAIYTTSLGFVSINSVFTSNTATTEGGGAVFIKTRSEFGVVSSLFCTTNVSGNSAPATPASSNLYLGGAIASQYCALPLPAGTKSEKEVINKANCTGCSGCPGDCNGNGDCSLDADLIGVCSCKNSFDPATACTACQRGYSLKSACSSCAPGYIQPTPSATCTACKGLQEVLSIFADMAVDIFPAKSAQECQKACAATKYPNYSNLWAYFDESQGQEGCAGQCILMNNRDQCRVSEVFYDATYKIHYQHLERAFIECAG